jgi:hypothetical protein
MAWGHSYSVKLLDSQTKRRVLALAPAGWYQHPARRKMKQKSVF